MDEHAVEAERKLSLPPPAAQAVLPANPPSSAVKPVAVAGERRLVAKSAVEEPPEEALESYVGAKRPRKESREP